MYDVVTLDQHGRTKVTSSWISGQLAFDALRTANRVLGHTLRDVFITDVNGDVVASASTDLACEDALTR
jgi:hypothetical protein